MKQAAQLVAAAEASEAQGQFEQAATQYRQAEEAFRAALVSARQAGARRAIEDELPALRAARRQPNKRMPRRSPPTRSPPPCATNYGSKKRSPPVS